MVEDCLSSVIGCTPIRLEDAHLEELHRLIQQLPDVILNSSSDEGNLERFEKLIQLYSDEPHLLDPALPSLVDALLRFVPWPSPAGSVGSGSAPDPLASASLIRLRALSIVRGYKFLMRFLPHRFELMEAVLCSLEYFADQLNCSSDKPGYSKSSVDRRLVHILTVWLSIICKNPFNLAKVISDGNVEMNEEKRNDQYVEQRIIACLERFQQKLSTVGELAIVPTLLAQILTRNSDNRAQLRPRFIECQRIFIAFESELDGGQAFLSHIRLLIALLKWGHRHELRPFALALLHSLPPQFLRSDCSNILIRDMIAKLLQRIAIVLLRPRLARWRYRCGHRSLEENLCGRKKQQKNGEMGEESWKEAEKESEEGIDEDEDGETPYDEIEKLLGELLLKVVDKDNAVRWTAAKGVARICARIPLRMASEVVSSLISSCFVNSADEATAWHGGCLALAELCRRGCLLPQQIPELIHRFLSRALTFEQSQLGFMQSVNVRDAACYICWAFARAYEASVLKGHLHFLAGTLVSVALFDREVNIRRAASAAYQENVGRNDSFPHGIEILSMVDYCEVARVRHCYLDLAEKVARFSEYVRPMLDHLCDLKSRHWDENVRELASEAIQRLAPSDPDYAYEKILPTLCSRLQSSDPTDKHGAFLGVATLITVLARKYNVLIHRDFLLACILEQSAKIGDHRTAGFSLVCKSLCRLIEALCTIGCELSDEQLAQFHNILDIVVADSNKQTAQRAMSAFSALMPYYRGDRFPSLISHIRDKYFVQISGVCQSESIRCSSIIPLRNIHADFLPRAFDQSNKNSNETLAESILQKLIEAIHESSRTKWVFVRVTSIQTVCVLLEKYLPPNFAWDKFIDCLILSANDFTTTTNGDIGRFARRAAVKALCRSLPYAYSQNDSPPISQQRLDKAIGIIVERACEAIDDIRERACTVLGQLAQLDDEHPLSAVLAERTLLRSIFNIPKNYAVLEPATDPSVSAPFSSVDWRHSRGFVRLASLLDSTIYGNSALAGFVLSAGSVCSWTSQNAFLAIATHLSTRKQDVQFLRHFLSSLLSIHSAIISRRGDPSPVLVLFRMLLNDRQLQRLETEPDEHPEFVALCELTLKLAVNKGKPKVKALAVSVLGSLLQLERKSQIWERVLRLLLSFLTSAYGSLREQAAEQLFEAFTLLDGCDENAEENGGVGTALELLSQTDWGGREADEELAETKERIAKLLQCSH